MPLLPSRFSVGPSWIIPAVIALLLVAVVVADRARSGRHPVVVRALSVALLVVLVDLWDDLVLPRAVRSAWAPVVAPSNKAAA